MTAMISDQGSLKVLSSMEAAPTANLNYQRRRKAKNHHPCKNLPLDYLTLVADWITRDIESVCSKSDVLQCGSFSHRKP